MHCNFLFNATLYKSFFCKNQATDKFIGLLKGSSSCSYLYEM